MLLTPEFWVGDTNMLVSKMWKFAFPDGKPRICVSPDAKPRRQSVEYRWRWVFALGMYTQTLPDANPVFGGIWALGKRSMHIQTFLPPPPLN